MTDFIILAAALNVLPLSDTILTGSPLRDANLFKLRMKVVVEMSETKSRCTARITQHVYKQIHTLLEVPSGCLTYSGLAKSTPVWVNGGASSRRNGGKGGGESVRYEFPSNPRHTVHFLRILLMTLLPFRIQN